MFASDWCVEWGTLYLALDPTSFSNRFGIDYFILTGSLAYRIDQNPLENLGVMPDILYEITDEDLRFGYQAYVEKIQNAINMLIQKN